MGVGISGYGKNRTEYIYVDRPLPNPKPDNFKIGYVKQKGKYLIALVEYPDCTNFEGVKLMVFCGITHEELLAVKTLDPHFSDMTTEYSPIARFRPTVAGWDAAELFVDAMNNNPNYTKIFPPALNAASKPQF